MYYKYPAIAVLVVLIAFFARSSFWELDLRPILFQSLTNLNFSNQQIQQDEMAASVTRNVINKVLSIEQSEVRILPKGLAFG